METTFAMIKPDAVKAGLVATILLEIERHGFAVVDMMKMRLSRDTLEEFYAEHRKRPFFGELIDFMSSGPVVALTLRRDDAIKHWRFVMGATDPKLAAPGTIRSLWGSKTGPIMWNCVHGSDSPENVGREVSIINNELVEFGDVTIPIPESQYGVHAAHCCQVHGCKYETAERVEEARCPVETGKIQREKDAGWCQEPGLVTDPDTCRHEGERMPGPDYHA